MSSGLRDTIKELNIKTGESARVTYQNGILLKIERNQQVPQPAVSTPAKSQVVNENMHIDKKECRDCPDKCPDVQPMSTSENSKIVSQSSRSGEEPVEKTEVHMQLNVDNIEKLLAGKSYEEIYTLKEKFDKLAKIANIKDAIDAFDKERYRTIISELTGIISSMEITSTQSARIPHLLRWR